MATFSASAASAVPPLAVGDPLPELRGSFLTEREAVLPGAAAGRVALLLFGFTYDSRFAVEPWANKFHLEYRENSRVTYFEVPMISGINVLGKWFINRGMRSGTPQEAQENVITVYGGVDPWKVRLGFSDPKAAYLVLLDQNGRVAWAHNGGFTDEAYYELSAHMRMLLDSK
jgi:hypothetical protein